MPPGRPPTRNKTDAAISPAKVQAPGSTRRSARTGARNTHEPEDVEALEVDEQDEDGQGDIEADSDDSSGARDAELASLDGEWMLDSLADLYNDSLQIIALFDTANVTALRELLNGIQISSTTTYKRLNTLGKRFLVTREPFSDARLLLLPDIIVEKLSGVPEPNNGPWRPDHVVHLSNMASALIALVADLEQQRYEMLNALMHRYPMVFTTLSHVDETTVQVGNDLLTQLFIKSVQILESPNQPAQTLQDVFNTSGEGEGFVSVAAKTKHFLGLVQQRHDELHMCVDDNNIADVDRLTAAYPFEDCVANFILWALEKTRVIKQDVDARGGVDAVVSRIRAGDFSENAVKPKGSGSRGRGRKSNPTRAEIQRAKQLQAQTSATKAPRTTDEISRPSDEGQMQPAIEDQESSIHPELLEHRPIEHRPLEATEASQRAMAALSQAEGRKENIDPARKSFFDRQPDAQRLYFDDTQGDLPTSSNKRRQPTAEPVNEDDDDPAYENDVRPSAKRARVNKGKGRALTPPTAGYGPVEQSHDNFAYASTQPLPQKAQHEAASRLPASSAPILPSAQFDNLPGSSQHEFVQQMAKQKVQAHKEDTYHQPQVRRRWEQSETDRLYELIQLNGPRYAKILKDDQDGEMFPDGPMLQNRGQVQLKDKARNIKFDYLK